ncbi:cellulose binding domain-containing protein [Thalassotalea euphylliae]|uniref:PKD domain-containing protein n=1 Tax=Thalassotalea euphylliae TaxID=1655234 RepID=A0A3E0TYX2_9GAMM|nr:cellulose binding domain-containing protein [Thalassotalea euphylliae]REL29650.1 PKD domain-containing protein [Thalassotalea euphylliae]
MSSCPQPLWQKSRQKCWRKSKIFLLITAPFWAYQTQAAQCEFSVVNQWPNGYQGKLVITNDSTDVINGWQVDLAFSQNETIGSAWNANLSGSNPYTLTNKGWNAKINSGDSKSFGFNGTKPNGSIVSQPTLGGVCDSAGGNSDNNDAPFSIEIDASTLSGVAPLTVDFTSQVVGAGESDVDYVWQLEDESIADTQNTQYTFDTAGDYTVTFIATRIEQGLEQALESQLTITVEEPQPESAQCQLTIEQEWNSGFRARVDISNTANQAIDGWQVLMQFEDATKITGVWHGNHTGNNPYTVVNEQYNSTIAAGQSINFGFNAEKPVPDTAPTIPALGGLCSFDGTINNAPTAVAIASVTSGEGPLSVTFNAAQSADIDGDELTYLWGFGDGNSSTDIQPTHIYQAQGNYSVTLTVNDGAVSSSADLIIISVSEPQINLPYVLDSNNSSLYFVSTKKEHTVETHTFRSLSGAISIDGEASLQIDLSSVDTGVDTRDSRMTEHLFAVDTYPFAQVSLPLDYDAVKAVPAGSTQLMDISATLNLYGADIQIDTQVQVSRLSSSRILVQNSQPILLDSTDFGLEAGIETLRTLANLTSISYAVPVNFNLVFNTQASVQEQVQAGEE